MTTIRSRKSDSAALATGRLDACGPRAEPLATLSHCSLSMVSQQVVSATPVILSVTLIIWFSVWCSLMTRIPIFNILVLGLQLKTHSLIQGILVPLSKTHCMALTLMQAFPILSVVCLDSCLFFFLDPNIYSMAVFRLVNLRFGDKQFLWVPRDNLGVFHR